MYVIIGANGFLGSYLINSILTKTNNAVVAADMNLLGTASSPRVEWVNCDITRPVDVENLNRELTKYEKKFIFLSSCHHPDLVEKNPRQAWNVNITALSYFMNEVENVKCFYYPSTDSVYGESSGALFKESDEPNPINLYGRHKTAAEYIVNAYGYNVVRFPFLIGPSLLRHKEHFYDEIAKSLINSKPIVMFTDSFRSSLDFRTVADLLVDVMEKHDEQTPKILNISGDDALSKYDVGCLIAKKLGVSEELIVPAKTDDAKGIFGAKRAKSTLLDNTLVKQVLGIEEIKMVIA